MGVAIHGLSQALADAVAEAFRAGGYELGEPADTVVVGVEPSSGVDLLDLRVLDASGTPMASVVFSPIQDRQRRSILSVRDQNTFEEALRKKRLMSLIHLFLIHRYKATSVHYVSPTDDNQYQARKMKDHGLYSAVAEEIGHIIAATVDVARIQQLLASDGVELQKLIEKRV